MQAPATPPIGCARAYSNTELLIAVIARLLQGCKHVAVGAASPIPGSGTLLARELSGEKMRVSVLNSQRHSAFTNGGVEIFDLAAQGRLDAFFLSGGQIDGEGNINLVGSGTYPQVDVRWPGSFGSAYLYYLIPRVILFREEHTRRVLVPRVDFVSAPGVSDARVYRPGGPYALLTRMALFAFQRDARRFRLESVHPGHTLEEVRDNTGFDFECGAEVPATPAPDAQALQLIRGSVRTQIAEVYPRFAESLAPND